MSIGPTGVFGSVAGTPLSQAKGSDIDQAKQETDNQAGKISSDSSAEKASGIGAAEQDGEAQDGDADGRKLWEPTVNKDDDSAAETPAAPDPRSSRDATGERGNQLDLGG